MATFGLLTSAATATEGHNYGGQFGIAGSQGAGGIQSGGPSGLAVRTSTGDVFVTDNAHTAADGFSPAPRIERFNSSGAFQTSFGFDTSAYNSPGQLAFDQSGASLYVGATDNATGAGAVLKYSAAGVFGSALDAAAANATFTSPVQIAVNPTSGAVYASATDNTTTAPVVVEFDATGAYVATIDGTNGGSAFGGIAGLAVDGSGRLYVSHDGAVDRYSGAGAFQLRVSDGTAFGSTGVVGPVTADPSGSDIFVFENGQIAWYTNGGATRSEVFGQNRVGTASALGVLHSDGTVFLADTQNSVVQRFSTFTGPTVTTSAASGVASTTATLNGTIDPGGEEATFHFEYGTEASYGTSTAEESAGSGNSVAAATASIADLLPNTTYHYRLVGSNGSGTINGDDQTFITSAASPAVDTSGGPSASALTPTGGTLNAFVDPKGTATTFHFEYGTTTAYGSSTTPDPSQAGAGNGDVSVSTPVTGLQPGTLYHFRVVADNGVGSPTEGADGTFITAPGTPASAENVQGTSATLSGVINPHGVSTTYQFDYGLDANYGTSTTPRPANNSGNADVVVTQEVQKLQPGTTYHFRVVAVDVNGLTRSSDDATFTTAAAPTATTGAVTGVGTDTATLNGSFDPRGLSGTYQFFVTSTTSTYTGHTEPEAFDPSTTTATGTLTDLAPGQTYTVRLSVTTTNVTTPGDTVTFSTAPQPPVAPGPPPPATVDNPYGCTTPTLAGYDSHPKPGDTIKISGSDLGVGGDVTLGTDRLVASDWTASGFSLKLPEDAEGTLPLTINCGKASNTVAIAMFREPSNTFTVSGKAAAGAVVKGSTATVRVKVPGPGSISARGGNVATSVKHAGKAGTFSVKVKLNAKAKRALARKKKLDVSVTVRFTPNGGETASDSFWVSFRR